MAKDIDLMAKNAKTYNEPGSQVFKVRFKVFLFPFLEDVSNKLLTIVLVFVVV